MTVFSCRGVKHLPSKHEVLCSFGSVFICLAIWIWYKPTRNKWYADDSLLRILHEVFWMLNEEKGYIWVLEPSQQCANPTKYEDLKVLMKAKSTLNFFLYRSTAAAWASSW